MDYDFSNLRRALELRKKYGLTDSTVLFNGPASVDHAYRLTSKQMLASPVDEKNWKHYGQGYDALAKELGFQGYLFGMDEPGYDATGEMMKKEAILCRWSQEAGFKLTSAITLEGAKSLNGTLALPILDGPTAIIGPDRRKLPFPKTWVYWHPTRMPTNDRVMAGLCFWYGGYDGVAPWIYKSYQSEKWDDWSKDAYGYALINYVFPGEDGPVSTREYEGFREGINDTRYLEMLNNRVLALADRQDKLDADAKAAWKEAEHLVNHAPAEFQGTGAPLANKVDGKMLSDFRAKIADLLVKLDAAAKAQGVKL